MRSAVMVLGLALLAGCSDAASETPIEMTAGSYAVAGGLTHNLSAGPLSMEVGKKTDTDICFTQQRIQAFPASVLMEVMPSEVACRMAETERSGNLFTGVRRCSGKARGVIMEIEQPYEAVLREDGFEVEGTLALTYKADASTGNSSEHSVTHNTKYRATGAFTGEC